MATYKVQKIDLTYVGTIDEYHHAINESEIRYCEGLKEVEKYCGGKLHKQRNGYSGVKGNIEYIAERI